MAKEWLKTRVGKKLFPKTHLLQKGNIVFEWDLRRFKSKHNPGVGKHCGEVTETPTGESVTVKLGDGSVETIEKANIRVGPGRDSPFGEEKTFLLKEISGGTGVKVHIVRDDHGKNDSTIVSRARRILCKQCKQPTSGMHACPACKKPYHTVCLLSFNKGGNKICIDCYKRGVDVYGVKNVASWKPDTYDHDPYETGPVPFCKFTKNFFYNLSEIRKMQEVVDKAKASRKRRRAEKSAANGQGWKRCREGSLSSKLNRALNTWFQRYPKPGAGLYTIFQRTVRKFKAKHKGRPYDKEVVNACIDSVKEEMPPERNISLPPLDEIHECVEALFPTPEPVADTDATDATTNVPTTFDVTKPEDITLEQCVASVEAMMAKIQWLIAIGDDDGYPPRGEGPPSGATYSPETLAHKQLTYLNKYSVYKAFEGLRDRGLFPCICKDTPFGKWCNFPIVLNAFGILYCHYQGLFQYPVYLRFFHVDLRFLSCVLVIFSIHYTV